MEGKLWVQELGLKWIHDPSFFATNFSPIIPLGKAFQDEIYLESGYLDFICYLLLL